MVLGFSDSLRASWRASGAQRACRASQTARQGPRRAQSRSWMCAEAAVPPGGVGAGQRSNLWRQRGGSPSPWTPDSPRGGPGAPGIVPGPSGSHGKGSGAPGSALSCLGRLGERLEKISEEMLQNVTKYYKMLQTLPIFRGLFSGNFRDFCKRIPKEIFTKGLQKRFFTEG